MLAVAPPVTVNDPPAVILEELLVLLMLIPPEIENELVVELNDSVVLVDAIPDSESTKKILLPKPSIHFNLIEDIY